MTPRGLLASVGVCQIVVILPCFIILGIVLLAPGVSKHNGIQKNYGCKIVTIQHACTYFPNLSYFTHVCQFVPNMKTGYGYMNPNAMNITAPLTDRCIVIDPVVNCSIAGVSGEVVCYAMVSYPAITSTPTTRTQITTTSFSFI